MRCLRVALTAAVLVTAADATAQSAPAGSSTTTTWLAQGGYERFALRDISRTTRPPDASPIAWRGAGAAISGRFERSTRRAAQLVDASASHAGNFAYTSPIGSVSAAAADVAGRFDVRYEYRRYFFRDVLVRGLDIGTGLQAVVNHATFERHITTALSASTAINGWGPGLALSARLARWDRAQAYVTYVNGATYSHLESRHSARPEPDRFDGGSWFTDLAVRFDWRLTAAARISASWRHGFEEYQSDHLHYAANHHSFNIGVLYAR